MLGAMEQLTYSTLRIECSLANGGASSGTGFIVNLLNDGDLHVPVLVSNKHVIAGSVSGAFHLTYATADGRRDTGQHQRIVIPNFEAQWILHPNPAIDLAIFPLSNLLDEAERQTGRRFFYRSFGPDMIATAAERTTYSSMEDVVMIGYPNGLWDHVNNLPIIRRGVTATHVKNRWRGKDEFLTDIASFPGSSGSPVLLANFGNYVTPNGDTVIGTRVKLLGIHYAGFMHQANGEIVFVPAPTSAVPVPVTGMPNNLGVVINSLRILDFEAILRPMLRSS